MIEKETRVCLTCKRPFEPKRKDQVYCSKQCRMRGAYLRSGEAGDGAYFRKTVSTQEQLTKTVGDIERYNREHGTNLSYGQYVVMMEQEKDSGDGEIKDSGDRTEFATGAVRDLREGKGRCDLLPLDTVAKFLLTHGECDLVILAAAMFQDTGDTAYLNTALDHFKKIRGWDEFTTLLEVAKHFEAGAKKYGERNWQKGIPVRCYIDSGVRHYLKWLRGDTDEPHDRAFCWNLICAAWTCKHMPELNEYGGGKCDR